MPRTAPSLTIEQLKLIFGVSHVTIYNWSKNIDFPAVGARTTGAVKRWAREHKKLMVREPLDVLTGRTSKKADAAVKRSALRTVGPRRLLTRKLQ